MLVASASARSRIETSGHAPCRSRAGPPRLVPHFACRRSSSRPRCVARSVAPRGTPAVQSALRQLRYLRISYWGFDHRAHLGEMVVNASAVWHLSTRSLRCSPRGFRFVACASSTATAEATTTRSRRTTPRRSTVAAATGSSRWSEHAYGLAIDINPIENPYVYASGTTTPHASVPFLDRSNVRPGMAVPGGVLVRAFDAIGWGWGGRWPRPTDFQHFSVDGR